MFRENVPTRSEDAFHAIQVPERTPTPKIDASRRVIGRLSVILPTYDRKGELQKAVDSLDRQTYSDIEVVVADDTPGGRYRAIGVTNTAFQ